MSDFNIIPYPTNLRTRDGHFHLGEDTRLYPDNANLANAEILQNLLHPDTGFPLDIDPQPSNQGDNIHLTLQEDLGHLGEEGYQLSVSQEEILLRAATPTGIFYAIQTLRQLLPPEIESAGVIDGMEWQIPCLEIEDIPRYPWRGYMLDEARHFQGIKTVKKLLDLMALFKLNHFHWHLTDDQGWRIEIKKYPLLTEVGAKRAGTVIGNPYLSQKHDHIPHEGFYTQDEIRDVIDYARERHIMVVPEIEIPGHSTAALAAYPEFSCTGGPFEVPTRWGIFPEIYCAGKPETYEYLKNILREVMELFPAPYIHIGGDEAPKKRWKACPDCQQKMVEENLRDEDSLQVYMVNQIAEHLRQHGKRIIFWSDSFDSAIDANAIVHFWIGNREKVLQSIKQGQEVINSSYLSTYLDQTHTTISLEKTQKFNPAFASLTKDEADNVLGFEGLMWGEWLPNYRRLEYQTFPRLIALAEGGWVDQPGNYKDFRFRLEGIQERLDLLDVGYARVKSTNAVWQRIIGPLHIPRAKKGVSLPVKGF